MTRRSARRAVLPEQVDAVLEQLQDLIRQGREDLSDYVESPTSADLPFNLNEVSAELARRMRATLEAETVLIEPLEENDIRQRERDHEIIKKALIGLKLAGLKRICVSLGLTVSGNAEEVATRIANIYNWDSDEIADLILRFEEEPEPDRGFVSRLYMCEPTDSLDAVGDRLRSYVAHYVRTAVAQWFVFDEVRPTPQWLIVLGSHYSYRTRVDYHNDESRIVPEAQDGKLKAMLATDGKLDVRGGSGADVIAALNALQMTVGVRRLGYVPNTDAEGTGAHDRAHPRSIFMLDLVANRLASLSFSELDVTVVRFQVGAASPETGRKPKLRAIRAEGSHLFDEPDAARLLVRERRPLTEVALRAGWRDERGLNWLPIKFTLEKDHLVVATGFGTDESVARDVHAELIKAAWLAFDEGVADEKSLDFLLARIEAISTSGTIPTTASIIGVQGEQAESKDKIEED